MDEKIILYTSEDGNSRVTLYARDGSVSNKQMEEFAGHVYDEFHARRKQLEVIQAEEEDMNELLELEKELKRR